MKKSKKATVTKLNAHDRKILDRYTGFYTNFIESNTAKTEELAGEQYKASE